MHVQNEELVLEECLRSVAWADEIMVVDSFSTDRTKEIARKYTDKIYDHKYENSALQKNWCLANLPFRNDWLLLIDADERITPELADEIGLVTDSPGDMVGYYIRRRNYFLGKEIKYCWSPGYELRLFKKGTGLWDGRRVHSELVLTGPVGTCSSPMLHFTRDSIFSYIQRLNRHTTWEAEEIAFRKGQAMMNKSPIPRPLWKRVVRSIWGFLPGKPILFFLHMFIFKRGFLDGYRGFLISIFQSFYIFLSEAKKWELTRGDR